MQNLREEIEKILDFYLTNRGHVYEEFIQKDDIERNLDLAESQATDQILEAVDGILPKKKYINPYKLNDLRNQGFNSCLAYIRERIVER